MLSIQSWEIIPNVIHQNELSTQKILKHLLEFNIKLLIIHEKDLYPGHAQILE